MKKRHKYLLLSLVIGLNMMACKTISEPIVNLYSSSTQDVEQSQRRSKATAQEDTKLTLTRQAADNDGAFEGGNSPKTFPDQIITASLTNENSLENGWESNQYPPPGSENGIEPNPGPGEGTPNLNLATPTITQTPNPQSTPQTTITPQVSVTPLPTNTKIPITMPAWIASEIQASNPGSVELTSGSYQFIEFFAYWCGTCLALAPEIHTLETHYGERINFVYLDIDDPANDIFKQQLHYHKQPQFYLLDREGNVVRQWLGTVAFDELVSTFESILNSQ